MLEAFSKDKYAALEHAFYENDIQSPNALFHSNESRYATIIQLEIFHISFSIFLCGLFPLVQH